MTKRGAFHRQPSLDQTERLTEYLNLLVGNAPRANQTQEQEGDGQQAETSIDKLSASDQNRVRAALGGEMPYGGCLSTQCLDQKTVIEKDASGIPRCKRCQRAPGFSDEYFMRTRSQRRQDAMDFGLMRERFAYDHDDADPLEERPAKRPRLE